MSKSTKYAISGTGRWGALRFAVLVLALCLLQAPGILAAPAAAAQAGNAAAKHRVQGTVVDQAGAPVIGANVIVEGTTTGTTTDAKGAFSLEVPAKGRLLISYLGYETQQVTLTSQTQYMVTLRENTAAIADVVVVGYGVQRKESVVGAISQVKGDALVDSGVSNITNALAGKLSGVTTLQTSGQPGQNDAEILIRGVSSFSNSNPLVLVDGVERDFSTIDPNEVANISVLKDASATAVFGAKGANGVIIVTTRTGSTGKPKMNISLSYGLDFPTMIPDHIGSAQTAELLNVALKNAQSYGSMIPRSEIEEYARPSSRINSIRYPDNDWFDIAMRRCAQTINANYNALHAAKEIPMQDAVKLAEELIDSGKAQKKLEEFVSLTNKLAEEE